MKKGNKIDAKINRVYATLMNARLRGATLVEAIVAVTVIATVFLLAIYFITQLNVGSFNILEMEAKSRLERYEAYVLSGHHYQDGAIEDPDGTITLKVTSYTQGGYGDALELDFAYLNTKGKVVAGKKMIVLKDEDKNVFIHKNE